MGKNNFLTAICQIKREDENQLVGIIDVEKVLANIIDYNIKISDELLNNEVSQQLQGHKILIVDDSPTARNQIKSTLMQLGIEVVEAKNGQQAYDLLDQWCHEGKTITDEILMMFTDAEMPEMDGYRLTHKIRHDPRMADLYITLNTSLSGSFNEAMTIKVGCNRFIFKFQPDLIVEVVQNRLLEKIAS